jgi:hypothetical protein
MQSEAKQSKSSVLCARLVAGWLPLFCAGGVFLCAFGRLEWDLCVMDNQKTLEIHS